MGGNPGTAWILQVDASSFTVTGWATVTGYHPYKPMLRGLGMDVEGDTLYGAYTNAGSGLLTVDTSAFGPIGAPAPGLVADASTTIDVSSIPTMDPYDLAVLGDFCWTTDSSGTVYQTNMATNSTTLLLTEPLLSTASGDGVRGMAVMPVTLDIPADFDGDGDVDGADFLKWQQGYPTASGATKADGDTDGDGDVDGQDFLVWQQWYPYP